MTSGQSGAVSSKFKTQREADDAFNEAARFERTFISPSAGTDSIPTSPTLEPEEVRQTRGVPSSPAPSRAASSHPAPATPESTARRHFAIPTRHSTPEALPKAPKIIYNVCSLSGIIARVKEGETPINNSKVAPSFGYACNFYFETHGYTDDAKALLGMSFHAARDEEHFVQDMAEKGMPMLEALYIHTLIAEGLDSAE